MLKGGANILLNYISKNLLQCLSLMVSFIALSTSIYSIWINRKKLDVSIENSLSDINDIYLNHFDYENNKVAMNLGKGKVCYIKIVNPSPKDISYFDFTVFNLTTNKRLTYINNALLDGLNMKDTSLFADCNDELARLNYPNSNYGIFKSNSFTRLDIAFYPENKTSKIHILFKVAIPSHSFKHYGFDRRCFKTYHKVFNVDL